MTVRACRGIQKLISPLVGEFMAEMIIKSQCRTMGIKPDEIRSEHIDTLSKKISTTLAFHGHRDQAETIEKRIGYLQNLGKK